MSTAEAARATPRRGLPPGYFCTKYVDDVPPARVPFTKTVPNHRTCTTNYLCFCFCMRILSTRATRSQCVRPPRIASHASPTSRWTVAMHGLARPDVRRRPPRESWRVCTNWHPGFPVTIWGRPWPAAAVAADASTSRLQRLVVGLRGVQHHLCLTEAVQQNLAPALVLMCLLVGLPSERLCSGFFPHRSAACSLGSAACGQWSCTLEHRSQKHLRRVAQRTPPKRLSFGGETETRSEKPCS